MEPQIAFLLTTAFGNFLQELMHWYDLKGKLNHVKYQKMIRSKEYWTVVFLMLVSTPIACYILYYPKLVEMPGLQMLIGAAFPVIFKKLVSGVHNNQNIQLGKGDLGDYFN